MKRQRRYGRVARLILLLETLTMKLNLISMRGSKMVALHLPAMKPRAALLLLVSFFLVSCDIDKNWSMVYEAIQVPELVCDDDGVCVPGDQKRFVLFNEDKLTRLGCKALFNEHLRRLNNNAAVIEYEIGCSHLRTKGHGIDFQYQNQWLLP